MARRRQRTGRAVAPCRDGNGCARQGLVLTELLMALASVAILTVTAGLLLVFGYASWRCETHAVNLQRNATAALARMIHVVREASAAAVTVSAGRLEVTRDGATMRFQYDAVAGALMCDPNTGLAGDETPLVPSNVTGFAPTKLAAGVSLQLVLQNADESIQLDSQIAFRN